MIKGAALPGLAKCGLQPIDEVRKGGDVARIELQRDGLAAKPRDFADGFPGLRFAALVGEDDVMALARDGKGGIAAQASARTRDERNLAHGAAP
ncbi:hypothetical protein D3C78_1662310 [compost metagenome]